LEGATDEYTTHNSAQLRVVQAKQKLLPLDTV